MGRWPATALSARSRANYGHPQRHALGQPFDSFDLAQVRQLDLVQSTGEQDVPHLLARRLAGGFDEHAGEVRRRPILADGPTQGVARADSAGCVVAAHLRPAITSRRRQSAPASTRYQFECACAWRGRHEWQRSEEPSTAGFRPHDWQGPHCPRPRATGLQLSARRLPAPPSPPPTPKTATGTPGTTTPYRAWRRSTATSSCPSPPARQ